MHDFVQQFTAYKKEFLREAKKTDLISGQHGQGKQTQLDVFEKWLAQKNAAPGESPAISAGSLNSFLDEVLLRAQKILRERGINISYLSLSRQIGIAESWKCIKVFGRSNIFYRIGRTKPRKGPYKGKEYLVVDLVMDGHKRQVFNPLLKEKGKIENKLGLPLARELPNVEATGKYRFKLMLPYKTVEEQDVALAAGKLADFVDTTKPYLDELGVV